MTETVNLATPRFDGEPLAPAAPARLAEAAAYGLIFDRADAPATPEDWAEVIAAYAERADLPGVEDAAYVLTEVPEAYRQIAALRARAAKERQEIADAKAALEALERATGEPVRRKTVQGDRRMLALFNVAHGATRKPDKVDARADALAAEWWPEEPEELAKFRAKVIAATKSARRKMLADPVVVAQIERDALHAERAELAERIGPEVVRYIEVIHRLAEVDALLTVERPE